MPVLVSATEMITMESPSADGVIVKIRGNGISSIVSTAFVINFTNTCSN